jgi:lipoyl(octanoyl) transferase
MHDTLTVAALGTTPYRDGLALQQALVRARAEGASGDWLLYPDHPPVLTVGRNPSPDNLRADRATIERLGVEWFEVTRGGDVTFHGPGQLVGYPIVGLERVDRDLHRWLRELEQAVIDTVAAFGVAARRSPGRTGVWVDGAAGEAKLASIGVAVRRWVGWHGFALNVAPDLRFFDLIHPCGLHGIQMASLAGLRGDEAPSLAQVRDRATAALAERLGYSQVRHVDAEAAWRAAGLERPAHAGSAAGAHQARTRAA